jgi:hypothetical protein
MVNNYAYRRQQGFIIFSGSDEPIVHSDHVGFSAVVADG